MKLFKRETAILLLIGILSFILLRLPSLFEPYWYGDEGVYAAAAQEASHGEMLYKDIWDNKPHPIYWVYMLAGKTNPMLWIRIFNLVAGITTIIGIYFLAKKLLNKKSSFIAFFIAILLLATPLFEGNIANGENFFLPFLVWGLYLGIDSLGNRWKQIITGVFFGVGILFKLIALLDFAGLLIFLVVTETKLFSKRPQFRDVVKLFPLLFGFSIPLLFVSVLELLNNNFANFINATLFDMFSYVGYSSSNTLGLVIFQNSTLAKLILLALANVILILNFYAKKINKKTLFISLVLLFEYFATLVSARHYVHYLLQVIPGFVLITALIFQNICKYKSVIARINAVVIYLLGTYLGLIFFTQGDALSVNYGGGKLGDKSLCYKIYAYYENFISYRMLQRRSKEEYHQFFNDEETKMITLKMALNSIFPNTPRDKIYIYTDRAWSYPYLHVRVPTYFSVAYHRLIKSNGNEILIDNLVTTKPELIVVEKNVPTFDEFDQLLRTSYEPVLKDEIYSYYTAK